ncbi:MAG: family 16 glycosylhydrolase [Clostridia bacterium]|nr:family 16 glycosylhydrolase [Clostridia bacterium]
MKTFKKLLALLCTAALLLTTLSVGTVFAADTTVAVDYSNINFDGENGITGSMGSTKWSFYDASESPVGGNATKMLKVKADGTGPFNARLLADGNYVAIESGKAYALTFDYYVDANVDLKGLTVRDSAAIVTDKSVSSGLIPASELGVTADGTSGAWKRIKLTFAADEDANLGIGISYNIAATTEIFAYFDNFSLVEMPAEAENDYSAITFDTENGTAGTLGSTVWEFYYDAYKAPVAGNNTRMLRLSTTAAANYQFNVTYGANPVPLTEGAQYRLDFWYYAEAGVNVKQATVRNQVSNIQIVKLSIDPTTGTNGAWVKQSVTFIAPEGSTSLKMGVETNSGTQGSLYLDNFSLVMLYPPEKINDYTDINFDTANGIKGSTGSSYVTFYDAREKGIIAGNDTRMLSYFAKGTDNAQFNVLYGGTNVPLMPGKQYRIEFDIYAEAGIDINKATIRDVENNCLKDNVLLPVDANGTNGKWVRFTAFFTTVSTSTALKMSIKSNTATNKYLYIDNISLTLFDSEDPITFEGKNHGAAVDSSTEKWRYSTDEIAGNATTKLVFSHTNGQANGTVYNDFDETVAITKGGYYIIKFDYYSAPYTGSLGAIFNNDIGYKCNLSLTAEEGTGGAWKTSSTIFKATGSTDKFRFSMQPQNASDVALYLDNVAIVKLYDYYDELPVIESLAPGKLTVTAVEGYEYSVDGTHFFASGAFKNLNSETGIYPVYVREALADNGYPSAPSEAIYVQLPYAGDINNDRLLNADDLVQLSNRLLSGVATEIDEAFFDANIDTFVDIRDIVNLKKQIADEKDISSKIEITRNGVSYSLAWNDEFSGSYIDRNNWADRKATADSEYQYFKNDSNNNLFIDNDVDGNSCLILQAVEEEVTVNDRTYAYTSGGVDTYGKFTFKTGYVEMRAKLPQGAGLWSGFWFGGTSNRDGNSSWPANGEIDVIEHYGYKADTVFHNFHYATYDENNNIVANKIRPTEGEYKTVLSNGNFYDEFHTFGCEWTEEYVAYYVDGVMTNKFEKDAETFAEVNNENMYLLLTLAVGGSEEAMEDIGSTNFPAQMAIDYVRYYN